MNETLTAITGVRVGHAHDAAGLTGCTVVLFESRNRVSVSIAGGSPGTYNIGPLLNTWRGVSCDAIFLAGGSIYGLDAAAGVRQFVETVVLSERPKPATGPASFLGGLVTGAVIFDLQVGSATSRPDASMGYAAAANASTLPVIEGNVGVGCGATVGKFLGPTQAMKSGVGSVCFVAAAGFQVGALVVVNALGNVFDVDQGQVLAGARTPGADEITEFTTLLRQERSLPQTQGQHTTLGVIVTDVELDALLLSKMACAGQDGLARAVRPAHTALDGDTFFAVTTAQRPLPKALPLSAPDAIIHLASEAVRVAILRAVKAAHSLGSLPGLAKE
ncbi:MAG: P1 family peptidase [Candidatus Binatia bacterium]